MVIVHRLGPTGARYYLGAVGPVDGESPRLGEAPGRWVGRAAPDGPVTAGALAACMPDGAGRLPGLDVMFAAPKSVSVLHALAGDQVSADVRRAHDQAVDAGIAYLERHTCRVRVQGRVEVGGGFTAAAFRHRTSRADDPHLHTHVVVANAAMGGDGRVRALHTPTLYAERRGAAATYHLVLRGALTASLGLRWEVPVMGRADAVDVPDAVRAAFSRRRTAVIDASGSLADRRWAEHVTRPPRDGLVDYESMVFGWHRRATFNGWRAPDSLVGRPVVVLRAHEGLLPTGDRWSRGDLLVALAGYWRDGASPEEVRAATERLLASREVVPRSWYFTTRAAEARVQRVDAALVDRRVVSARPEALDALCHEVTHQGRRLVLVVRDASAAELARARAGVEAVSLPQAAAAVAALQLGDVVVIAAPHRLPSADVERALLVAGARRVEVLRGDPALPALPHAVRRLVRPLALGTVVERGGDCTAAPTARQAADLALGDWLARRRAGGAGVVVAERDEVDELNRRARAALRDAALLGAAEVSGFAVGDVVRFTHARPASALALHAQGEVVALGSASLDLRLLGGARTVRLRANALCGIAYAHVVPPLGALLAGRGDVFVVGGRTFSARHLDGAQQHRYVTDVAALDRSPVLAARDAPVRARELSLARHAPGRGAGRFR